MQFYDTNMTALEAWRLGHRLFGPGVAQAFGMPAAELALVGEAPPDALHRWGAVASPLVRPRPGLLGALHADRTGEIYGFIADARTRFSGPKLNEAFTGFNHFMLGQWHAASGKGGDFARYELEDEDHQALLAGGAADFRDWAGIPLAMAIPRAGIIRALAEGRDSALYALLGPWRRAS